MPKTFEELELDLARAEKALAAANAERSRLLHRIDVRSNPWSSRKLWFLLSLAVFVVFVALFGIPVALFWKLGLILLGLGLIYVLGNVGEHFAESRKFAKLDEHYDAGRALPRADPESMGR